ncbi:MAG: hypothetical protein SFZ02_11070 [bacterium]|nr:hypothetical protein [bacterium]
MTTRLRISIVLLMGCVLVLMGAMFAQPSISTAQIFVTNTPLPPDPLEISPNLPAERYALRLWTAPQFLEVFISLLGRGENSAEFYDAVHLIQYELAWRFPNAPQDAITRQRLFNAMLTAPRGSVDMRGVARPLAVAALQTGQLGNFHIDDVATLNIDGDAFPDTLYHLRYPADDAQPALYSDYIITRGDTRSSLAPMPADVFAAPYDDILGIDLLATGDYTGDGLDEVLISLDYAGANNRLVVYGWRNNTMTDLALAPIEFGEAVSLSSGLLQVVRYEVESEKWGCYRSKGVNWVWSSNFFRPVEDTNPAYLQLNTIGCQMVAIEPLYEKPPADALTAVNTLLLGHASDETGYAQVILATAMLEWLNGEKTNASLRVISLNNTPNLPVGIQRQIAIFQDAIAQNESAVVACANLSLNNGVCDIDQLITRILAENPISRAGDVGIQLEAIGLPVESVVTVSQVGRADRLVATFALAGASQWAFAPLGESTYVVEKLASAITRDNDNPQLVVGDVPATAWTALIINNDGISALNILDNAIRQNSALATSLEIRYFRAFAFDRIGDRPNAINGYYQLWRDFPDSLWGKLAGAHLEPR